MLKVMTNAGLPNALISGYYKLAFSSIAHTLL